VSLTDFAAIWALPTALGIEKRAARVRAWFWFPSGLEWGPSHLDVVNSQCLFERIRLDPMPEFRIRIEQTFGPLLLDTFSRSEGHAFPIATIALGPRLIDFSHIPHKLSLKSPLVGQPA
jgi:hypothetical protein